MSNGDLVSIVIPVYNAGKYLDASIGSLLGQTYEDIEIILVEDGSTDDSLNICRRYASSNPKVRLITHDVNKGYGVSRNDGIDAATGFWVMLLDADDEYLPDAVEKMVSAAESGGAKMVFSTFYSVSVDGIRSVQECGASGGVYSSREFAGLCLTKLSWEVLSYPCTKIYSRKFLNDNGIRLSEFHDGTFLVDALSRADRIALIAEPLAVYYIRKGSMSNSYRPGMYQFINEVDNRLHVYLEENGALDPEHYVLLQKKRTWLVKGVLNNVVRYRGYAEYKAVFNDLRSRSEVQEQFKYKWKMHDIKYSLSLFLLQYRLRFINYLLIKCAIWKL